MACRVDALIAELAARHGIDTAFLAKARPAIEQVLSDDIPAALRVQLLEFVAETCERQAGIQRDVAALQDEVDRLFAHLRRIVREPRRFGSWPPIPGPDRRGLGPA